MDVIEFIGFIMIMVASIVLSFKRKKEKKESIKVFEKQEIEERKKTIIHRKKEKLPEKVLPPVKRDKSFDMHDKAFVKKEPTSVKPLFKSLREAVIIQEIMNKPKGLQP